MTSCSSADRTQLIMDLGAIQAEATQRGDARAVDVLRRVAQLVVELGADSDALHSRRNADRERQRHVRSRDSRDSVSSSSKEISLVTTDYYSPSHVTPVTEVEEKVQVLIDLLRGQVGDEEFPAIDEFIRRRPYRVWKGWLDEMSSSIGAGSQFSPKDLVRVCKDDAALDRPIASPRGMRSFLLNARMERVREREGLPAKKEPPGDAGRIVNQIRALVKSSPTGHKYINKTEVAALGVAVLTAYEQIGGADRFVNLNPEYLGLLVREFGNAMRGAA